MEKFICPRCGKTSYTANRELMNLCPYCNINKFLILSPKIFTYGHDLSDVKIIIDRRKISEPVPAERREDYEVVPIAWLVIKRDKEMMIEPVQ